MLTVIIGLTFGAIELRQVRNAQESQAFVELYQTIQTPEYARAAQLASDMPEGLSASELRELLDSEEGDLLQQLRFTFEGLGVMVYRRDIPIEWVDELFRFSIVSTWEKFEPLVLENRAITGYDGLLEWHQWLYDRLMERDDANNPIPAYEAFRDWP